jgi:hypothetical protein
MFPHISGASNSRLTEVEACTTDVSDPATDQPVSSSLCRVSVRSANLREIVKKERAACNESPDVSLPAIKKLRSGKEMKLSPPPPKPLSKQELAMKEYHAGETLRDIADASGLTYDQSKRLVFKYIIIIDFVVVC